MDTAQAAAKLGTTPRTLRQFLRTPGSTFCSVGSGSRYEFTESDLPTLERRFRDWESNGKAKGGKRPRTVVMTAPVAPAPSRRRQPSKKDRTVWQEEGPVVIEDIRQPHVRKRVLEQAKVAEDRLMMLLMSKGLHISQLGDTRKAS